MKGRAVLRMPMITSEGQLASPLNSLNPRQPQTAQSSSAAKPIRLAASQNGVMPSSASLISRKVPPQTKPRVAIISQ